MQSWLKGLGWVAHSDTVEFYRVVLHLASHCCRAVAGVTQATSGWILVFLCSFHEIGQFQNSHVQFFWKSAILANKNVQRYKNLEELVDV